VFGPQTGYFMPQLLVEKDVHGPGIDARGVAFAGSDIYVQLGRGPSYAWSATSASADNVDQFVLKLCEPGGGTADDELDGLSPQQRLRADRDVEPRADREAERRRHPGHRGVGRPVRERDRRRRRRLRQRRLPDRRPLAELPIFCLNATDDDLDGASTTAACRSESRHRAVVPRRAHGHYGPVVARGTLTDGTPIASRRSGRRTGTSSARRSASAASTTRPS
jgi:hypothetical protein